MPAGLETSSRLEDVLSRVGIEEGPPAEGALRGPALNQLPSRGWEIVSERNDQQAVKLYTREHGMDWLMKKDCTVHEAYMLHCHCARPAEVLDI